MVGQNVQCQEGRYVYCIVEHNRQEFTATGIDGNKAYLIAYNGIGAVVHNCPAKPYESKDENKVKMWILSHHDVVEKAMKNFSSLIPLTFDTIIKGNEGNVKKWLKKENVKLKAILEKSRDKLEFTVQIFFGTSMMKKIEESDLDIIKIKEQMKSKPKGTVFMLNKKLRKTINEKLSAEANKHSEASYNLISKIIDEVKQENLKRVEEEKFKDKNMILNLSCLVHKSKVDELSKTLEEIGKMENIYIRFTGPWAPYSFFGLEELK